MTLRTIHADALLALCQHSTDAVIVIDEQARISHLNSAAERILHHASEDIAGHSLADIPEAAPLLSLVESVHQGQTVLRAQVAFGDDDPHWVQIISAADHQELAPANPAVLMSEIVHNLKGPLASAKSFIDLVEAAGELHDRQTRFVHKARLSLVSMLNQVHQIEDMAWLSSHSPLNIQPFDISEVIRRALVHLEGFAQQQGVTISVELSEMDCPLSGDAHRLESVVANLVHNAIKYSPRGGPVTIHAQEAAAHIVVRVIDQGLGIPQEHIPHLFDQFYRVRNNDTAPIEGSGLGLAIVKTIVEKHGGSVFVESKLGEGSTFGFRLPCEPVNPH